MKMYGLTLALLALVGTAHSVMVKGKSMAMDDAIMMAAMPEGHSDRPSLDEYEKMTNDMMQGKDEVLVELDMVFKRDTYNDMRKEMEMPEDVADGSNKRKKRKAIIPASYYRWPNKRIPYEISYEFSSGERSLIMSAIADYHKYTCLRFVPYSASDSNRIRFQNGGGCSSYVGQIGGVQPVSLAPGCRYKGIIIHEMGHAVGFQHEQTRPDRDNYVSILTYNIQSGVEYNFMKYSTSQVSSYQVPYDYTSVMHYSDRAFSRNGQRTIIAKDARYQGQMGNREGLSFKDIQLANKIYDCAASCPERNCPTGAFLGPDCKCWCDSGSRSNPVMECGGATPRPEVTTTVEMSCNDNSMYCGDWKQSGYCTGSYVEYMKRNCKLSCGYCQDPTTTTTTTTMATPPITGCEDKNQYCSYWANSGECSRNPGYMSRYCQRSCNMCPGEVTTMVCKDMSNYCPYWTDYCNNDIYRDYLKMRCMQSCGHCRGNDEESATSTAAPTPAAEFDPTCMDKRTEDYCRARLSENSQKCRNPAFAMICKKTCGQC